jgi:L-amino acid N-acyltransferase YncA
MIRPASSDDAKAIARIYNHYVINTVVTFEERPVEATDVIQRLTVAADASLPWLVAVENDAVVGYAYAGRWHARSAYRYSAESTLRRSRGMTRLCSAEVVRAPNQLWWRRARGSRARV